MYELRRRLRITPLLFRNRAWREMARLWVRGKVNVGNIW